MKLDDVAWHSGGKWPRGLPASQANVHIGMFWSWLVLRGLTSSGFRREHPGLAARLRARKLTPGEGIALEDGKLTMDMVAEGARAFVETYYGLPGDDSVYVDDYIERLTGSKRRFYFAPDTWASFRRLAPRIDQRWRRFERDTAHGKGPLTLAERQACVMAVIVARLRPLGFRYVKREEGFLGRLGEARARVTLDLERDRVRAWLFVTPKDTLVTIGRWSFGPKDDPDGLGARIGEKIVRALARITKTRSASRVSSRASAGAGRGSRRRGRRRG